MKYYQIVYRDFRPKDMLSPNDYGEFIVSAYVPWEEDFYIHSMSYMDNFALLVSGISDDPFVMLPDGSYINKNNIFKIIPAPNVKDEKGFASGGSEKSENLDKSEVNTEVRNNGAKNWNNSSQKRHNNSRRNFRPQNRLPEKPESKEQVIEDPFTNAISMNNHFAAGQFDFDIDEK